tara:strand:+ start:1294 stop:2379 length:1086 start_codon:yes stop_codon:yes gene_type:complete
MTKIKTNKSVKKLTYKKSGVNIELGNKFVKKIKPIVKNTYRKGVMSNIGGFGGLFDLSKCGFNNPILVSATDGVGTKLLLSKEMNKFDTIGIDLVAMNVNDIVVQGAEPLFFLDYFATDKLEIKKAKEILLGISKGLKMSNCALIGGETAELPNIYNNNYDLAGFAVGAVEKNNLLPKKNIKNGDIIIALKSSGVHSNGFSLVRKILKENNIKLNDKIREFSKTAIGYHLLKPTKIYVKSILQEHYKKNLKACAHITGGGIIENLPRVVPDKLCSVIYGEKIQPNRIFNWLKYIGNISSTEMLKTFNCGIGMCLIVDSKKADEIAKNLNNIGEEAFIIGYIENKKTNKNLIINNKNKIWKT